MKNFSGFLLSIVLLSACGPREEQSRFSFTSLGPEHTGIHFRNDLNSTEELNTYTYRNFYNGAGVALGDINNDGLVDIYFCGNQVDNKLYLNQGNLTFKDITAQAGVASRDVWSTGASMVDVDGDGLLDIYVCKSGPPGGPNRNNELFINNGDLTFTEKADDYGIDDTGLSNHAAFFDYDKDGDLDMYLLNNSLRSIGVYDLKIGQREERDPYGGNKLYRNDGSSFTDVSSEAGIYGSAIGFGLGVTVSDLNGDGWPDLFISNDFFERDYCYLNNQDGTFSEVLTELMPEISMGSMGADIGDLNNDGRPEIYVTEMLPEKLSRVKLKTLFEKWDKHQANVAAGYHYQYTRNMLQQNLGIDPYTGRPLFSDISRMTGTHATDWSWGAIIADFDNDGLKDIYVANGIAKDLTDHDYVNFYANNNMFIAKYRRDSSVLTNLVKMLPSTPVSNYYFTNHGKFAFEDITAAAGLAYKGFSNGSAYGDLDNDGDLDLVVSNIDDFPKIYRNEAEGSNYLKLLLKGKGKNTSALGSQVFVYAADAMYYYEQNPVKGYMSSMAHELTIGTGIHEKLDSMVVQWPDFTQTKLHNIKANQTLEIFQADASGTTISSSQNDGNILLQRLNVQPSVVHEEEDFVDFNRDRLLFHMRSNEGPKIAFNEQESLVFLPRGKGHESGLYRWRNSRLDTMNLLPEGRKESEDVSGLFVDVDQDGDMDLYVCSGGNEHGAFSAELMDRLYIQKEPGSWEWSRQGIPDLRTSTSAAVSLDYDRDGDLDMVVASRLKPFGYGVPVDMYLLENDGSGKYSVVDDERSFAFKEAGLITDLEAVDVDADGWSDLVAVGEWMPLTYFKNNEGIFARANLPDVGQAEKGFFNALEVADLNDDGKPDFICANIGLNTRLKASVEEPLTLFINDFDNNGTLDHIVAQFEDGKLVPLAMLGDLLKQLPVLKKKFVKFADYKDKSVEEIFGKEALNASMTLEVTETASFIYLSSSSGYSKVMLPQAAQTSAIYDVITDDFNRDGIADLLIGGNQSKVKPELGAYRGSYGMVLLGKGQGRFNPMLPQESGLVLRGDVRSFAKSTGTAEKYIFVGKNSDEIEVYAVRNEK